MSEETTTVTEETTATPEVVEIEQPIDIRGKLFTIIQGVQSKGRGKGKITYYLKVDLTKPDPFADIKEVVGIENWNRAVMVEVVQQACRDATHDSLNPETGEITDVAWANQFCEQFLPSTRRSGTGVKQLREKKMEIFNEISPLMLRAAKGEQLSAEENNRYLSLMADYAEIDEKIEKASRKGKKK